MNTPTERRGTRLLCTFSILLGIVTVTLASIAMVRDNTNEANVFAGWGAVLIVFAGATLVYVNRQAKR